MLAEDLWSGKLLMSSSATEFQSSLGYLRRKEKEAVEEGKEERGTATEI